jgi:hypothetical protein
MATFSSVWIPDLENGSSAGLVGPGGDSGAIQVGTRRLIRIWTDATSGINIMFGIANVASPGVNTYAIGPVPQDFDTGDMISYIRFVNNGTSPARYFLQFLSKF